MRDKPAIGITMGDPAGIGPEITAKALANAELHEKGRLLVLGDRQILQKAVELCGLELAVRAVSRVREGDYRPGVMNVVDMSNVDIANLRVGEIDGGCGRASYAYVKKGTEMALKGELDALVTGPVNKEALKAGGIEHIGHTEMLAALTGSPDPLTMFQVRRLRIFFLSRHVSLRQACGMVKKERLLPFITRCAAALERLGISGPKLAVAALNPHAGEHGLFGREEMEEVLPAVLEARKKGYDVEGPVPADAVFHLALKGAYDAVLSLYHDQGHIAAKMVDFEKTVSVTHNLPFLRTSVDHGTAFDLAGKGKASAGSMEEAIKLAIAYAPRWRAAR